MSKKKKKPNIKGNTIIISEDDIKIRKNSCPPTKKHEDKKKYNRKEKHKEEAYGISIRLRFFS
jgi:hypothetical protein